MPHPLASPLIQEERLHIVILNWNGWQDTLECLESVFHSHHQNRQVIVCDNNSQDNSLDYIKMWAEGNLNNWLPLNQPLRHLSFPPSPKPIAYTEYNYPSLSQSVSMANSFPLVLIQTGKNLGFAGGHNVGLQYIMAQKESAYIWLLNNDIVIAPNAISHMIALAKKDHSIGLIGCQLLYYDHPHMIQGIGGKIWPYLGRETHIGRQSTDISKFASDRAIDHLYGASIFLKSETLQDIGLIDESYFMYREETDWCLNANKKGWQNFYCARAKAWHKESISTGKKSERHDYYLVRNMLFLIYRFYPLSLPTALIGIAYQAILPKLIRRQFYRLKAVLKGYLDFFLGKRGPYQI